MSSPRMTIPTRLVLEVLVWGEECYGRDIMRAAGLPSGTVHPILARLEGLGWATSRWERIDPSAEGRPARRYYRLSPEGREQASAALARSARATPRPAPVVLEA